MNSTMLQSSMKLFKKRHVHEDSMGTIDPTVHMAFIAVKNEHFEVDYMLDLSDLTYTELQNVVEFAEFQRELRNATGEDFNFQLGDDDQEVSLDDTDDDDRA